MSFQVCYVVQALDDGQPPSGGCELKLVGGYIPYTFQASRLRAAVS